MRSSTSVIVVAFLVWSSSFHSCHAIRWHPWRLWRPWYWRRWYWRPWILPWMRHHHHHGGFGGHLNHTAPPPPLPPSSQPPPSPPYSPHNNSSPPAQPPLPPPPSKPASPSKPPPPPNKPLPLPPPAKAGHESVIYSPTFNVLKFGARGDGKSDNTKAFQLAWAAACQVEASTVLVPEGYEFLVRTVSFEGGKCRKNIIFQLDGTIVAPMNRENWGSDLSNWIVFSRVTGLTVQGKGTIEGRGLGWWHISKSDDLEGIEGAGAEHLDFSDEDEGYNDDNEDNWTKLEGQNTVVTAKVWRGVKPTALRIYRSDNATLKGIKIQNSPNVHVKIMNCNGVKVHDLSISSPGDSPNTDGIQVHRSRDVVIHSSSLACGDDCIAIQKGCHNVKVYNVTCGPGHGISIGSLGPDHSKACVSDVTVWDINMHDTMNGARIKTWQGGMGSVQGVTFTDIRMSRVRYPIIVDQYYCDKSICSNQTSAVAVSGVTYKNIRGTFTDRSILFACSDSIPCTDITLDSIDLQPVQQDAHHAHVQEPLCWQVFGEWTSSQSRQINCNVQGGKPSQYDHVRSNLNLC